MGGTSIKFLISGDRNWTDYTFIHTVLEQLIRDHVIETIIHGGTQGADTLGGQAASSLGLPVQIVKAEWSLYHKAAGPIRNQKMLELNPDKVLAFHDNLDLSKGTKHMILIANKADVPAILFYHDNSGAYKSFHML